MSALLVFTSSYGGFAALALAMDRYQQQVWQRRLPPRVRRWLQALGGFGLALALWACVVALDWSVGIVSWFGVSTATNLILALGLTYLPQRIASSAAVAWLLAAAACVASW